MISIIIPVYNVSKFLPSLFDSIENQTYKDFEIIFVNDASTDNSLELLKNFESKGTVSVNLIDLKVNAGVVNARNIALDNARGEFIAFADSDDILSPFYCEDLFNALKKDDSYYDFVCSRYVRNFSKFKHIVRQNKPSLKKQVFEISGFSSYIKHSVSSLKKPFQPYICMVAPWGKLFKREIIEKNNIRFREDFKYSGEDLNFINDYMKYVKNIVVINSTLYFWRDTPGSLSSSKKNYKKILCSMQSYFNACTRVLDENKYSNDYNYLVGERFFNSFYLKGYFDLRLKKQKNEKIQEILNVYNNFFVKYYSDYKKTTYKPKRKFITNILYWAFVCKKKKKKSIDKINLETEQNIAFDMLVVFDKFCRENDLKYSLICGTLLGAVRHKGFIPWDDDIDVCMPLPDYKRLMELWDNKTSGRYQLASNYLDNFNLAYSTINDSKTYVKNSYTLKPTKSCRVKGCDEHVKLDIFCFSGLPANEESKKKFCKKARSYYLKALGANARLNNPFFSFITLPYYFVLRCLGHKYFLKKYENLIANIDYDTAEYIGRPAEGNRCVMLPKSDFDNLIELQFGGGASM